MSVLSRSCPHCSATVDPYGESVARYERCPHCRRFVRTRASLAELILWACLGSVAAVPVAVVAASYTATGRWLVVAIPLVVAAAGYGLRSRSLLTDPRDGTAVHLQVQRSGQDRLRARYVLRSTAGVLGDAQLDLRSGRIRLGHFHDPRRRARYAAYLDQMFADFRPGSVPPDERFYSA